MKQRNTENQVKARGEELMAISETIKILNNAWELMWLCWWSMVYWKQRRGNNHPKDDALESFKKALPEKTSFLQVGLAGSQPLGPVDNRWSTISGQVDSTLSLKAWCFIIENSLQNWRFFKARKLEPQLAQCKDGRNTPKLKHCMKFLMWYFTMWYWCNMLNTHGEIHETTGEPQKHISPCDISGTSPSKLSQGRLKLHLLVLPMGNSRRSNKFLGYSDSSSNLETCFFQKLQLLLRKHEIWINMNRFRPCQTWKVSGSSKTDLILMALRGKAIGFDKASRWLPRGALGIQHFRCQVVQMIDAMKSTLKMEQVRPVRCKMGEIVVWWSCVKNSITGRRMKTKRRSIAKSSSIVAHSEWC